MVVLDMRGRLCPEPVIETRKVMVQQKVPVKVLVNDEVCRENVRKLVLSMGWKIEITETGEQEWSILANPDGRNEGMVDTVEVASSAVGETVVLLSKDYVGEGSTDLGKTLMKTFLLALGEQEVLPKHIYCINGGVHLTTACSPVEEQLKGLADKGVQISSCGICLDFYGKRESLLVGDITNMYEIVSALSTHHTIQI